MSQTGHYGVHKRTKPVHTQRKLYSTSLHWGSRWISEASHWGHKAFWIPTFWYRQSKSLVLGAVSNAKPHSEWVCVLEEYRLYSFFLYGTFILILIQLPQLRSMKFLKSERKWSLKLHSSHHDTSRIKLFKHSL